jgi:hypothetical protein
MPTELPPRWQEKRPTLTAMAATLIRLRVARFMLWIVRTFRL